MYIAPNTNIRVLHNCPLDPTYDHTLYFTSVSAQTSYFQSLTKYSFPEQTYQRVQRGRMRVERKAEDLYDCNYLMFQNTSFGSKWFYAFITGVEYINNITSEITFQIDVMQTWHFDYTLEQCFVEREHSVTDDVGDNLVPENLELGEYVIGSNQRSGYFEQGWYYLVAATVDPQMQDAVGEVYGGLYSAVNLLCYTTTDGLNQFFQDVAESGKQDAILAVVPLPRYLAENGVWTHNAIEKQITISKSYSLGYTPKNNKLYTYPYNFLYVSNLQGNSAVYPYEYFTTENCNFSFGGDVSCNPTFFIAPRSYKGVAYNYDEKLTLSGLPQIAYVTDSFKAWLAQNSSSLAVSAISTIGQTTATGLAFGGGIGAAIGAVTGIATSVGNILSQVYQASIQPPQAGGGQGSSALCAFRQFDFWFANKHIRPEFAKIIDDYFTMYGYATHRVKVPNRTARPHWNYVKTIGCVITGSVPADDVKEICNIYNNGITFWKNGNNVGNYSLDNSPN